jgi:hypothetical protein
MKTLHLNLTKKWFDMILSGEKKEEYREITDYWIRRLLCKKGMNHYILKNFDTITFSNGYSKNRRQFAIEIKDFRIKEGREDWGAEKGEKYFVIELGKLISSDLGLNNNLPLTTFDDYLQKKIDLAKDTWKDVDVNEYLNEVRGN